MDEIENLRRLLQEEQHRRQQAEDDAAEQRRGREEEQRRREEEQRRREEEQRRREEEQRRREAAEELAKGSLPQALPQYLDSCHSLSLQIHVVTDPSSTTQGDTTNPVGRIFPRRIIPWSNFATGQEEVWKKLLTRSSFSSEAVFPSSHQLDYVASVLHPISSETDLRHFELQTVENAVQKLVDQAYNNSLLRARLGIRGSVTFESHTNLGNDAGDAISASVEHMSVDGDGAGAATSDIVSAFRRPVKGKGGSADQFCIYRTSDGRNVPALAIEYKAPHKLTRNEVVTGLNSEIQPERDVINRNGEDFAFASRSLVAAVITQLFSYMIAKGIRYGYVCTGETFVFLHVSDDDPSVVHYSVSVPNLDVLDDDENRFYRTAVAQVFAFVLRALQAPPPPESWYDRAIATLDTWAVEYEDVLKKIPQSVRKQPHASPYRPQRWKGFVRSPIRTRSGCRPSGSSPREKEGDSSEEDGLPPSPSLGRSARARGNESAPTSAAGRKQRQPRSKDDPPDNNKKRPPASTCIENRLYCTQKCLSGLAKMGPIDQECPNAADHGEQHLDPSEFRRLVRVQLAQDRGPEADAAPLYVSGAIGSLFKVRLSAYGYTLVAKGVERGRFARLRHEGEMYNRLKSIQGRHVPVCLGIVNLILPYYYNGGVFERFMFLSWAGQPFLEATKRPFVKIVAIADKIATAFKEIHALRVLHGDAELRNILYDAHSGNPMVVDFERAVAYDHQPLGSLSHNRKRKHGVPHQKNENDFTKESQSVIANVWHYLDNL